MSLLIAGTGALACLFAARLIRSGNEVTMMGSWKDGLASFAGMVSEYLTWMAAFMVTRLKSWMVKNARGVTYNLWCW